MGKTLESPLDSKEIKPVNSKGNWLWIFIGRAHAEAEAPILWPPVAKSQLTGKDFDAEKDWRQKDKGATENAMVGWHHQLNGHRFEETWGDTGGQKILACCSPWGYKESEMTYWLNINNKWGKIWKKNRYMYMYNWITLLYAWNNHNIVNQLYSKIKWKFFLKREAEA